MNNRLQWITFAAAKLSGIIAICLGFSGHRYIAIVMFAVALCFITTTVVLAFKRMKTIPDDVDDPQWRKFLKQNE